MVDVLRDAFVLKDKLSMKMENVENLCLVQVGTVIPNRKHYRINFWMLSKIPQIVL